MDQYSSASWEDRSVADFSLRSEVKLVAIVCARVYGSHGIEPDSEERAAGQRLCEGDGVVGFKRVGVAGVLRAVGLQASLFYFEVIDILIPDR